MRSILFVLMVLFLFACNTSRQEKEATVVDSTGFKKQQEGQQLLLQKIKEADTVLLVSHIDIDEAKVIDEKTGKVKPIPSLLINDRPNVAIIKERKTITGQLKDTLASILLMKLQDEKTEMSKCFNPHHCIFLLKGNHTSYVDICFHCLGYRTSEDLSSIEPFDSPKWNAIFSFFKRNGFAYQMPKVLGE